MVWDFFLHRMVLPLVLHHKLEKSSGHLDRHGYLQVQGAKFWFIALQMYSETGD